MRTTPKPYERYRHFKGREYQVLLIAKNEKTMEDMVVYQALYEPYQIYVRELEEFLSETDKEKYPDAVQKYRFELTEEAGCAAEDTESVKEKPAEPEYADSGVDPVLMRFLDAEDGPEQLKVLEECAGKITVQILTPIELSLGMEPSTESVDERIRNIRNNITTKMRYEIRR